MFTGSSAVNSPKSIYEASFSILLLAAVDPEVPVTNWKLRDLQKYLVGSSVCQAEALATSAGLDR